jgi:hypothetical protein
MVPMVMPMVVGMFVPVVPKFRLVEQEEKHQTQQKRQKQLMGTGFTFEGFWQQMQKRRGHQGPSRKTQHVLGVPAQNTKTQPSGDPDAANARYQSAHQNRQ